MRGRALPSHLPSLSASQLRKQSGYQPHRLTGRFHSFISKVWGSKSNSLLCFTDNVVVFADSYILFFAAATFFPTEHFPILYPVMFPIAQNMGLMRFTILLGRLVSTSISHDPVPPHLYIATNIGLTASNCLLISSQKLPWFTSFAPMLYSDRYSFYIYMNFHLFSSRKMLKRRQL